jgi:hypothetical protein
MNFSNLNFKKIAFVIKGSSIWKIYYIFESGHFVRFQESSDDLELVYIRHMDG